MDLSRGTQPVIIFMNQTGRKVETAADKVPRKRARRSESSFCDWRSVDWTREWRRSSCCFIRMEVNTTSRGPSECINSLKSQQWNRNEPDAGRKLIRSAVLSQRARRSNTSCDRLRQVTSSLIHLDGHDSSELTWLSHESGVNHRCGSEKSFFIGLFQNVQG